MRIETFDDPFFRGVIPPPVSPEMRMTSMPSRRARRADAAAARSRSHARALGLNPPPLRPYPVQPGDPVAVVRRRHRSGNWFPVRVILGQPRRVRGAPSAQAVRDVPFPH